MNNRRLSFHSISGIFLIISMFPWVSFGTNDLDTQPWSFFIALFYLSISQKLYATESYKLAFSAMVFGLLLAIFLSTKIGFLSFRAAYNFVSFFIFYSIFYRIFMSFDLVKFFKVINGVWLLGAVFELLDPRFMEFFGKVRTSADRGLTSFAPEPSFFATNLVFTSVLILILSNYNLRSNKILLGVNILAVIFLARSAIGLAYLLAMVVALFGYHLVRIRPTKFGLKLIIITVTFAVVGLLLLINSSITTRMSDLMLRLLEAGPLILFKLDASMNERLAHIVFPIYGFITDFFLPHGTDTFSEARISMEPRFDDFFWYSMNTDKIMSWYGDWLFTLGLFGAVSLLIFLKPIVGTSPENIWTFVGISIILLSAVPLSYPLVPAIFAALRMRTDLCRKSVVKL